MPTDVIIDPTNGQIYWNNGGGGNQESIAIKGDALNAISFVGYSGQYSPGSAPGGAQTLATFNDSSSATFVPGTNNFELGSGTLRWKFYGTTGEFSSNTISSSLLSGAVLVNGGIAISGNASIGQSLNFYNTTATFYTGFRAGTISANTLYTLPTAFPGSASVLQSDTSGTLTWVASIGTATTATNVNVVSATSDTSHRVLFTPASGTASGAAVSSESTFVYNPSTDILTVSGLAATSGVNASSATSGAFQVRGGIGITGNAFIGGTINVASPITIPNGGTNVSSFGQSAGFIYYDGANVRLLAASGATINNSNGYYQFDNRVYATSFFAGGAQMPNGSGAAGRVTIWSGNNTIGSDAEFTYDSTTNILNVSGNIHGIGVTASGIASTSTTDSATVNTGGLIVSGGAGIAKSLSIGGYLQLFNTNNYTSFVSSATANTIYTLPSTSPATGVSVLQSTAAGVMSWVPMTATSSSSSGGTVYAGVLNQIAFYGATGNTLGGSSTFTNNTVIGQVQILHTTASTGTSTGALQVAGGVGISGRLSFNQASFGTTGIASLPTMAMIGQTGDPIFMSILEDNSLSFEGSQGQLFSISPNLTTGYIWAVNDISGVPLLRANVNGNVYISEFGGNLGIGQTNPTYKLDVKGNFGLSSSNDNSYSFLFSNTAASGNNSLQVRSANSIQFYNSGNSFYTALKSNAAANVTYTLPTNDGSNGQFLSTNGTGTLSWATASGGSGSGSTGVNPGGEFEIGYYAATGASISGSSSFKNNTTTAVVSITHTTASTNFSNGALTVSGGVGIGGSLYVGGTGSSISGVRIASGAITSGAWNGTVIATQYGGTGQNLSSSSGVLTISSGTVSASTTSSAISSAISDKTGSGALTFATSPDFTTSVTTGTATFAVFNTNATTINAFGAAQTISLGASSGTATFNSLNNTISASSGALVISGGVGIGKSVSVGGRLLLFNGSTYTGFVSAQVGTGNTVYTLPTTSPATGSSVLQSTSEGVMSWVPLIASGGAGSGTVAIPDAQYRLAYYAGTGASVSSTNLITAVGTGVSILGATNASSTTSAALSVLGGLGITGNAFIGGTINVSSTSASNISNVILANGIITSGTWSGSTITAFYGGTGLQGPVAVGDLIVANTTTTWSRLTTGATSGHVLTSNGSNALPSWQAVPPAAASSVAVAPTVVNSQFSITAVNTSNGTGLGLSTIATFVINPSSGLVSLSGLAVTSGTNASSKTAAALTVLGGLGITGNAFIGGTINVESASPSVISGVSIANGAITAGAWNATLIAPQYGGTGLNNSGQSGILKYTTGTGSLVAAPSGAIVGTTDSQNLTNKTYNNLTITAPATNATLTIADTTTFATSGANNLTLTTTATTNVTFPSGTKTLVATDVTSLASLNTVGVISSGTWAGTVITSLYGGTGFNSYTVGDILYAATGNSLGKLPANANTGYVLTNNGTGTAPSWQAVPPAAASSVAVAPTAVNSQFSITAVSSASGTGLGLSTVASLVINPSTGIVSMSGLAVTASTQSTTSSSGALIVTGGASVGQTLSVGGSLNIFNGANFSSFKFAGTANPIYTLPPNTPQSAVGTSVLTSTTAGVMSWIGMSAGGSATPGGSNKQIQYNSSNTFAGASGFEFTTVGIANTVSIFSASGTGYTAGLWVSAINGSTTRVGIGLSNPQFELEILGEISATNKSFVIDHPTKDGMKLRYGSLEGPENGVYVRGELKGTNIIEVPDHWVGLVYEDSYTVHLTPIGRFSQLYVEKIENYNVFVADTMMCPIHCYYSVWAERKDIPKLVTEYEAQ